MAEKPKFAASIAHAYIQGKVQKPFLGKPYVLAGVFWETCTILFHNCSLLGRLFENNPEPFIYVLTAEKSKESSVLNYLKSVVDEDILDFAYEANSFSELLFLCEQKRLNSTEGIANLFLKYGTVKMNPTNAGNLATFWGVQGASLGINYPYIVEELFEGSYKPNPRWKEARELGLVIASEQPSVSIEEATKDASRLLREFTEQYYPEIFDE
jgi:hypothetical protein